MRKFWLGFYLWVAVCGPDAVFGEPIEVVICESHHHVLRFWLQAVREGRLPNEKLRVLHFDSHPDMAVPRKFIPNTPPADVNGLIAKLNIASFQLAAVRLGLVNHIVWLRPAWAKQFADGEYRFSIGLDPKRRLRVDSPQNYYVLEDSWTDTKHLREKRPDRKSVV